MKYKLVFFETRRAARIYPLTHAWINFIHSIIHYTKVLFLAMRLFYAPIKINFRDYVCGTDSKKYYLNLIASG